MTRSTADIAAPLAIFGLTPVDMQIYQSLLGLPPTAARTVAERNGLGLPQARRALTALHTRGLVTTNGGRPQLFSAPDPAFGIRQLVIEHEEALRQIRLIELELAQRYHQARAQRDPSDLIEFITGREQVLERGRQFERGAKRELRILDKPPYTMPDDPNQDEFDLLARGVHVRVVYDTDAITALAEEELRTWVAAGEQARTLPTIPAKLAIADDDCAWLPLGTNGPEHSASPTFVVLHPSMLLEALIALFEHVWERALPLTTAGSTCTADGKTSDSTPVRLEEQDRQIVGYLSAGLPDDAIARRLQISTRTFHRRVRALMSHFRTETRFQLGAQIANAGLLPSGPNRQ